MFMVTCDVFMSSSIQKQARTFWVWSTLVGADKQACWEGQTLCELYQALKPGLVSQKMLVVGVLEQGVDRSR